MRINRVVGRSGLALPGGFHPGHASRGAVQVSPHDLGGLLDIARGDRLHELVVLADRINELAHAQKLKYPRYDGGFFTTVFTADAPEVAKLLKDEGIIRNRRGHRYGIEFENLAGEDRELILRCSGGRKH